MDRKARRKYIEQVVNDRKIETQEELLKLLTEAGFETTQATISRDIHALNIVKANDGDNVRTIETVQFMNVIKTALNSSYATILAGMFDELDIPEVVGTLAGNDTLIVISKDNDDAKMVYDLIIQHMHS